MVSVMKYLIPVILLFVAIIYFIYCCILMFRYYKGDKLYGTVKDYKKYKRYRLYLLKLADYGVIDYTSTRFYMINNKILLSKYKDKFIFSSICTYLSAGFSWLYLHACRTVFSLLQVLSELLQILSEYIFPKEQLYTRLF